MRCIWVKESLYVLVPDHVLWLGQRFPRGLGGDSTYISMCRISGCQKTAKKIGWDDGDLGPPSRYPSARAGSHRTFPAYRPGSRTRCMIGGPSLNIITTSMRSTLWCKEAHQYQLHDQPLSHTILYALSSLLCRHSFFFVLFCSVFVLLFGRCKGHLHRLVHQSPNRFFFFSGRAAKSGTAFLGHPAVAVIVVFHFSCTWQQIVDLKTNEIEKSQQNSAKSTLHDKEVNAATIIFWALSVFLCDVAVAKKMLSCINHTL